MMKQVSPVFSTSENGSKTEGIGPSQRGIRAQSNFDNKLTNSEIKTLVRQMAECIVKTGVPPISDPLDIRMRKNFTITTVLDEYKKLLEQIVAQKENSDLYQVWTIDRTVHVSVLNGFMVVANFHLLEDGFGHTTPKNPSTASWKGPLELDAVNNAMLEVAFAVKKFDIRKPYADAPPVEFLNLL